MRNRARFPAYRVMGILTILPLLIALPVSAAKGVGLTFHPKRLTPASITLVRFPPSPSVQPVSITWHHLAFPFFKNDRGTYEALLVVPLSTRPGPQAFTLRVLTHGKPASQTFEKTLHGKHYRTIVLRLKKRAHLTPRLLERIKKERQTLHRLFAIQSPRRYWHGSFIKPVPGGITSPFGTRRNINGRYISIHHGTDFRAPMGTPVKAINAGVVAFTGNLVLSGKTVVIDHGKGLYSLYGHLSSPCVKRGDPVEKGQIIGLSGSTGRATGPHLHLGVILCGVAVDPVSLLHLSKRGIL